MKTYIKIYAACSAEEMLAGESDFFPYFSLFQFIEFQLRHRGFTCFCSVHWISTIDFFQALQSTC